ncbi:hypothetical protein AB0M41_01645 [Streptomyces sp. NPDC051896]|uniref:hypothetical protein n=1 Tax=Streptomyces sp. NPDC051896 TaxID=3155416 RepID=UPI003437360A
MRLAARAAVAASALVLVGLTSAPANAAGHESYLAHSYPADGSNCDNGAVVDFQSYGEIFDVNDTCGDGHSAVGVINVASSFYYYWNHDGHGTTRVVDLEFNEGQPLAIQACLGDWKGTATGGMLWSTCGPVNANVTA